MSKKFKIAFLTRGSLGFNLLKEIHERKSVEVPFIITCRHSSEVGSSVDEFNKFAEINNIPFHYTNQINKDSWYELFENHKPDLVVAIQWVNTISAKLISTARLGFLNCHGGMLPRYRGNACANWAILNQEEYHGITVHLMNGDNLDDGPILIQKKYPITPKTTIKHLMDLNASEGERLSLEAINKLLSEELTPLIQKESNALYCYPRLPRDGEINWHHESNSILLLVRAAGDPYPGAYTFFSDVQDKFKVKKMIINNAYTEDHFMDFCAEPGHLLKMDSGNKWAIVCGDKKLLILENISIGSFTGNPKDFFKTVRQRMSIDTETLLKITRGEIEVQI